MNKTTKKILLQYVLAPILLCGLLYLIYQQVFAGGDAVAQWQIVKQNLNQANVFLIVLVIIIAPLNWGLEAFKWKQLLKKIQVISYPKAFASTLTGMAFSLVTPNRVGDFAGRILYVKNKYKFKAAIASMIGSVSQMCVTASIGLIGLIYYNIQYPGTTPKIALLIGLLLASIGITLYLKMDKLSNLTSRFPILRKVIIALQILKRYNRKDLSLIFVLSFCRFVVYNLQFVILVNIMGANIPWAEGLLMSALMFWVLAVVPSVAMLDLGVRGYAGVYLFIENGLTTNGVALLAGSYSLWFLNLVIPAIIGSLLVVTIGYNKKSKKQERASY